MVQFLVYQCDYCILGYPVLSLKAVTHCAKVSCDKLRQPKSKETNGTWKAAELTRSAEGKPTLTDYRFELSLGVIAPGHHLMVVVVEVRKRKKKNQKIIMACLNRSRKASIMAVF